MKSLNVFISYPGLTPGHRLCVTPSNLENMTKSGKQVSDNESDDVFEVEYISEEKIKKVHF
jgi:hypothetical protein